jgi:membrane-bound ClpP family serine protease
MITLLANLTPDAAIIILTLGLALIALEVNRPGLVLPGAIGLLLTLLSCAVLVHDKPDPLSIGLFVSAAGILLLQLRCRVPLWILCLGAIAGVVGLARILPGIHPATALVCGLLLAVGTTVLTRLAHRARQNKGLD